MKKNGYTAFFLCTVFAIQAQQFELYSPNGQIELVFKYEHSIASYDLATNGKQIIENARLGLTLDPSFSDTLRVVGNDTRTFDEHYEMKWWKNKKVRNHYNELRVTMQEIGMKGKIFSLIFRAYDDGIAFRYEFPEQEDLTEFRIEEDLTEFSFVDDYTWWSANGERDNLGPMSINAMREPVPLPMVLKCADSLYLAIHEAAIYDFAHFHLKKTGPKPNTFQCEVQGSSKAMTGMPTSWRALFIGRTPGALLESNLLVNLNPPSKIKDASWIRTGISMWDWRVWGFKNEEGFIYGMDTPSHKRLIDFAARNKIDFLLMDADWYGPEFSTDSDPTTANNKIDIEENLTYAKSKNVGIILYLNDVGAKQFGLRRVLKQFHDWGAVGVKYGFMTSSGQEKVLQTRRVVELCAEYKLMVNFHDNPIPPSGDERTWPNTFTREYCHSQADAKYSYYPETAVSSAFINMLAGPLDMCNGWYGFEDSEVRPKVFKFIPGTVAAENAKLVVIFSGLSVLPDAPENYDAKSEMFDFVKSLPNSFDSYHVLGGDIESYISVARKAGENWYVGSLTTREPRELTIKLDFLTPKVKYKAFLYEDVTETHYISNREAYSTRQILVDSDSEIEIRLAPGGGNAIRIIPLE